MTDTHETIADIIAWLRRPREGENAYLTLWRDEIADRLEAAHKRESAVGDCAKLRKALEMVRDAHYTREVNGELYEGFEVEADDGTGRPLICIVKNALAAPPRNCDVGTAAEQVERWNNESLNPYEWGDRQYLDAQEVLEWAQMPY